MVWCVLFVFVVLVWFLYVGFVIICCCVVYCMCWWNKSVEIME